MAGNEQVEVYNPQGKLGMIPSAQLDAAKSQGYKPKSDFVEAVHPKTGQTGIIPKDQWGAAEKQGYAMSPREQQRVKAKEGTAIKPEAPLAVGMQGTGAMGITATKPQEVTDVKSANKKMAIESALTMGTMGAGALAGKMLVPTVTTETVGTGILGPDGTELLRDAFRYGPSKAAKALSKPAVQKLLKWITEGAVGAGMWKMLESSIGKKK